MDKDIITKEELQQLVNSSRNIELGETVIGSLIEKEIYANNHGITISKFEPDNKPKSFNLKRDFFKLLNDLEKKFSYRLLNNSRDGIIYHYDSLGRIYFHDTNGNVYYINSSKTGCVNEYGEYFDLRSTPNGVEILPNPTHDQELFSFLFITREAKQLAEAKAEKIAEREMESFEENPYSNLFEDSTKTENKVIDFTAYKEKYYQQNHHR